MERVVPRIPLKDSDKAFLAWPAGEVEVVRDQQ